MEDRESMKLGPYRLLRRLARGGMSEVYLVSDERDEQIYALKLISQRDEEDCQRFQHEISVLKCLKHQHILPILDSGSQNDICYYVMPYIAHGTVKERLERGPMDEKEAAIVLTQVADALDFLHKAGLVHRDVKPSNILQDETGHVWLADFGLVREIEGGSDLTRTGYLMGTPAYMAPELEDAPANVGSDVYALGIVLYEILTGHMPFTGRTPFDIYWKQVYEQPPFPSAVNPLVSPAIEQVVLHALEKNPSKRYSSAQTLAEAYQEALLVEYDASANSGQLDPGEKVRYTIYPVKALRSQKQGRVRKAPLAVGVLAAMALLTLSLVNMGAISHGSLSFVSNSPAQVFAAHPADGSPTGTATPPATTTPGSSSPSGSSPSGTTTSTPVSSVTPTSSATPEGTSPSNKKKPPKKKPHKPHN